MNELNQLENEELKQRLLTSMLALVEDKEIATMVEKLIEEEGLLMNTPFLQRIRAESRRQARLEAILDSLTLRFDPAISVYRELESSITKINDDELIERLFIASIKSATLADFQATLRQLTTSAEADLS